MADDKLHISVDDLGGALAPPPPGTGAPLPPVTAPMTAPAAGQPTAKITGAGQALPTITPGPASISVATPATGRTAPLSRLGANPIISGLMVGIIAGVVGATIAFWLNHSIINRPVIENGVLALVVSPLVGMLLAAWPDLTAGANASAVRRGAIGALVGLVAAGIAVAVADQVFDSVRDAGGDITTDLGTLKFALWLAWVILGTLVGLGIAIPHGWRKMGNGLIGGLIGGAVGGLLYVQTVEPEALLVLDNELGFATSLGPQLMSVVITTVSVCLAIGIVERVARQAWLRVVRGPLSGKEYILYRDTTTIGSGASCDVVLAKDATVSPVHARIERRGGDARVVAVGDAPVAVNGNPATSATLRSGTLLTVGTFELAYEER